VRVERKIPIYPVPFTYLFGRKLHSIVLLKKLDQ